jgi:hypothetical protein
MAVREGTILGEDEDMMDPKQFADMQLELAAEFAQYLADHPQADDLLPKKSRICFQIEGEAGFNHCRRDLAERQARQEGLPVVLVRIKGLTPPQGWHLIDAVIERASA